MKKEIFPHVLLISISTELFCQSHVADKDSSTKKTEPPKDRNMFGHSIPRGLKINSPGLADGYIMFAVANSPFIDLINRRGDVVHQWKSNYEVMNAYLMNDGSIVAGAVDPDFPTFGFGGPMVAYKKISWDGKMLWDYEYANEKEMIHHDFNVMPNGNILALAYETKTHEEAITMGRKPAMIPGTGLG